MLVAHFIIYYEGHDMCNNCSLARFLNCIQATFHYSASLWSNDNTFNIGGGKTGLDEQETKLPNYWNTSFSKICLGRKIGEQMNFIVMNKQVSSLFSLIADGHHVLLH